VLALVAGTGALPGALVAALPDRPLVAALEGTAPDTVATDLAFRLETLGSFLEDLRARGVTRVCFAGAITRPRIDPARIDAATMPLVPVLQAALARGDDGALRAAIAVFEQAGFEIVAAHAIAPALLPPEGVPTRRQPGAHDRNDAERGFALLDVMAAGDIGQSCVVLAGQALAVEGLFGTDWMLSSLERRPDGVGGVLCKGPKRGQDRRADLPVIGPVTVQGAARAGLAGIVVEAGGVMALEPDALIAACDAADLFLWVRPA
jgi:DUF1009 family protein